MKLNFEGLAALNISEETVDLLLQIKDLAVHGVTIKANKREAFDKLFVALTQQADFDNVKHCFKLDCGWLFFGLDYALIVAHSYSNVSA